VDVVDTSDDTEWVWDGTQWVAGSTEEAESTTEGEWTWNGYEWVAATSVEEPEVVEEVEEVVTETDDWIWDGY
jgi:hypothetical protein